MITPYNTVREAFNYDAGCFKDARHAMYVVDWLRELLMKNGDQTEEQANVLVQLEWSAGYNEFRIWLPHDQTYFWPTNSSEDAWNSSDAMDYIRRHV